MKVAIPLYGKMAARSLHHAPIVTELKLRGFDAQFLVDSIPEGGDRNRYAILQTKKYLESAARHPLYYKLFNLRRFTIDTETVDLRFRENVEAHLFDKRSITPLLVTAAAASVLRRLPRIGDLANLGEQWLVTPDAHRDALTADVAATLTPGVGSFAFEFEGQFARESQRHGIPVIANITNYDNLVNMGYRGFMPECLTVWSRQMADDAIRVHRIPAARIEITGPTQFDRYARPLPIERDAFLVSKGLDPRLPTICFAGGVNIVRYFEMYSLFVKPNRFGTPINFILRPYPHEKLLGSPAWSVLRDLLCAMPHVYVSDPTEESANTIRAADLILSEADDMDELHAILRYSDVLINIYSTISLEAAICDVPTIHLGYDRQTFGLRHNVTTDFQQRQTHNRRPARLAAARIATDEADVLRHVADYLADRKLDQAPRAEYAYSECGDIDGKSSVRLAEVIRSTVDANQ